MNRKFGAALLVPLMLVALAGLGFATFTSTATMQVLATAGTIDADFASASVYSKPDYTTTSITGTGNALVVTIGALAPGDQVIVQFNIQNLGNLPGTLSTQVTEASGAGPLTYSDTVSGTIGAGATQGTYYAYITLPAGKGTAGTLYGFTVTLTATAGS